jgi:hypothetical protein
LIRTIQVSEERHCAQQHTPTRHAARIGNALVALLGPRTRFFLDGTVKHLGARQGFEAIESDLVPFAEPTDDVSAVVIKLV